MNNRRKLLIALGAGALAGPFGSAAQQQSKVWRVDALVVRGRPESLDSDAMGAFVPGMRDLGYVEGKNLVIEWRFADGKVERLPELAEELVRLKPDAILATSTPVTRAIQQAIPVVMGTIADPVGSGFIKSLARPEGNITGLTNVLVDISPKHLEILLSVVPKLSRVAVLANPGNSSNIKTIVSPPSSSLTASSLNSLVKRVRLRPGLNLLHLLAHLTPPQVLSTFKSVHGNRDASVWPHLRTVLCHDCFCHCFQHIDESKSSGG